MRCPSAFRPHLAAATLAGAMSVASLPATAGEHQMPEEVKQSIGCVVTGTAGVAAAVAAGGENLINIIAGGIVVPQNRAVLYIGLAGVVFASFCAVGQALTPIYLYYTEPPEPAAPTQSVVREPQPAVLRTGTEPAPSCSGAGCAAPRLHAASRSGVLARTADGAGQRINSVPQAWPLAAPPALTTALASTQPLQGR